MNSDLYIKDAFLLLLLLLLPIIGYCHKSLSNDRLLINDLHQCVDYHSVITLGHNSKNVVLLWWNPGTYF